MQAAWSNGCGLLAVVSAVAFAGTAIALASVATAIAAAFRVVFSVDSNFLLACPTGAVGLSALDQRFLSPAPAD